MVREKTQETREASPGGGRTAMCNSPLPRVAQAMRPRASPSMPSFPGLAIAATTSNPCRGHPVVARSVTPRPSGVLHLDPNAVPAELARRMNAPPCREALCRTELVANSEAIRIASSAWGRRPSHPASSARASPTCRGSAG